MMTKDITVQQVGSTLPVPRKHVVGVFDSWQEGEQAVQALMDAGYPAQDIALIKNQEFPAALQEHVRKERRWWRLLHRLQITTDEGSLGELLAAAARQGSHITAISVPQREHVAEVSAILFKHTARLVKYIGTWSVEDLFPPSQEASVDAQVSKGVGSTPESDDQQPGPAHQPSDATRLADWGREQADHVSGHLRGPATGKDVAQAADRTDSPGGTMLDEQEGQEMNIEQAHQTNTDQYTGKPGVEAPSLGQDPGSAYGYDMDL